MDLGDTDRLCLVCDAPMATVIRREVGEPARFGEVCTADADHPTTFAAPARPSVV